MRTCFFVLTLCLWSGLSFGADESLRVLENTTAPKEQQMMRAHMRRLAHEAFDARDARYETMKSMASIEMYQMRMRHNFVNSLGGFWDRTPLNARTIERFEHAGLGVEKVIFESQPGFYVTGTVFTPSAKSADRRAPAVLVLCGHSAAAKAYYQNVAAAMARAGMVALCMDPIGQGERKQLSSVLDTRGNPLGSTTEHMIGGVGPLLLGRSITTYMIWDGMRAIDYLQSRDDVNGERIGVTGNSGGGNQTAYLMALDDRVTAAAPGCFITTTRRKNESPGPGDAEQNIFGQIAYGMDHADYIMMRAPRPTLILSATQDYVPIEGAWEAYREAKRLYARMGYAERVDLIEVDEKHGYSLQLREGAVRWMQRWLLNKDDDISEQPYEMLAEERLLCTPSGNVSELPGAKSVFDLYRDDAAILSQKRAQQATGSAEGMRDRIRQTSGIRPLASLPPLTQASVKNVQQSLAPNTGHNITRQSLRWDNDIDLPTLVYHQPKTQKPQSPIRLTLYANADGKHHAQDEIDALMNEADIVMAVDLRGYGETATTTWRYSSTANYIGNDAAEFFIANMLGKSILAMRAEDILVAARHFKNEHPKGQLRIVAVGAAGVPAMHAAALEPELFDGGIEWRGVLESWQSVIDHSSTKEGLPPVSIANTVYGALKVYDLPDLIKLIKEAN